MSGSGSTLDVAAFVHAELVTIFGGEFSILHGDTPSALFRDALGTITLDELERGLRVLHDDRARGVPNLLEIVQACRRGRRDAYPPRDVQVGGRHAAVTQQRDRSVTQFARHSDHAPFRKKRRAPPATAEQARRHIERMRERLGR
jgi:hypothetical protein